MDTAYALKGHTLASIVQAGDPVQAGVPAKASVRRTVARPARRLAPAGWASRATSFILMAPARSRPPATAARFRGVVTRNVQNPGARCS